MPVKIPSTFQNVVTFYTFHTLEDSVGNTLAIASGSGCSLQTINVVGGSVCYLSLLLGLAPLTWSVFRRRS